MVRPVAELREVSGHPLLTDVDVRRADRRLKQLPKAFNAVRMERLARPPVVPRPFFRTVLDGPVRVAIAG